MNPSLREEAIAELKVVRLVSLSQPYRQDEDNSMSTYIPAVDILCEFQGTDAPCLQP